MADSIDSNNTEVAELIKSLQSVTMLMQNLVGDLKGQSTSLALVKSKVENISDRVDSLMKIVIEGNGSKSVITRLALIEKQLDDDKEEYRELKEQNTDSVKEVRRMIEKEKNDNIKSDKDERKLKMEKRIAAFKLWGALLAAAAAFGMEIFTMIHK